MSAYLLRNSVLYRWQDERGTYRLFAYLTHSLIFRNIVNIREIFGSIKWGKEDHTKLSYIFQLNGTQAYTNQTNLHIIKISETQIVVYWFYTLILMKNIYHTHTKRRVGFSINNSDHYNLSFKLFAIPSSYDSLRGPVHKGSILKLGKPVDNVCTEAIMGDVTSSIWLGKLESPRIRDLSWDVTMRPGGLPR